MIKLEKYHEKLSYSYTFGAFVTIELLKNKINEVQCVLVHSSFVKNEVYQQILKLCKKANKNVIVDNKLVEKIRNKENIFVIGVFRKYKQILNKQNHIVINNINDYGIIGTILRSMNGFDFSSLILINSDIDIYHTHLIRASMGAIFHMNIKKFSSLEEYNREYQNHYYYYISKEKGSKIKDIEINCPYSILFGFHKLDIPSIYFPEDINIENIVNIIIYNLYKNK